MDSQALKSPWALIKEAWHMYTAKFKLFAALVVPSIVLAGASLTAMMFPSVSSTPVWIVLGIGSWIVNLWLSMSFLYGVVEQNPSVSAKEILRKGWRRIFSYLWITLLLAGIVMGGYFLLIIPGIMLSVWFCLVLYALAAEDTRGLNALLRSKQLVKGLWWQVVWRWVVFGVVIGVPVFIAIMVLVFVLAIALGQGATLTYEQSQKWMDTLQIILAPLQWIGGAFALAFGYALFEDLKRVKGNPSYADYKESKGKYIALGIFGIVGLVLIVVVAIAGLALVALFTQQSTI